MRFLIQQGLCKDLEAATNQSIQKAYFKASWIVLEEYFQTPKAEYMINSVNRLKKEMPGRGWIGQERRRKRRN